MEEEDQFKLNNTKKDVERLQLSKHFPKRVITDQMEATISNRMTLNNAEKSILCSKLNKSST